MNIQKCLIVDTETTGLDPKTETVIEIGVILYSIETNTTLSMATMLLPAKANGASEINHISLPMLNAAEAEEKVSGRFGGMLSAMIEAADVIVAHQASFDKSFLEESVLWLSKPWLCTKEDFRFLSGKPGDSLVNTALAHGVPVHDNHRAGSDITLIAKIFKSYSIEGLQFLFQQAMLPRNYYTASTGYSEKEKPKAAGFSWNNEKKVWWKKLTLDEVKNLNFPVRQVSPEAVSGR